MSDFDDYNASRSRRRPRPESAGQDDPRRAYDDWEMDDEPPTRRPGARPQRDQSEGWQDEQDWDQQDDQPPTRAESRRSSLMQRRLRAARGEEFDDSFGGADDYEPDVPARRYTRPRASYAPTYQSSGGCGASILYVVLGGAVVFVLMLLMGRQMLNNVTAGIPTQIKQVIATPTATIFDRGGTIKQIQSLNRLETSSFSVERVVEANVQRGNILDSILGERLLLIASGNVVAGVDMSKLKESDINISADGKSITIKLPPSEIFSKALDNQRTRVYDRQTAIGTQILGDENKDLETLARQEAEGVIQQAACEGGIMQKAADEAQSSIEHFLGLLKFQQITVIGQAGACVAPSGPITPTP